MGKHFPYILGLDLGSSSLGWCVLQLDLQNESTPLPIGISAAGVRIFEAGVEGDIDQGKDASRAVVRRQARQPRRQQWRRQRRKQQLFVLLQRHGLLPNSDGYRSQSRKAMLDALDAELTAKHIPSDDHDARQKLPYKLRDLAASGKVEPYVLGRAIYHLAQRRGYLSNRKGQAKDEDLGVVEGDINEMQQKLDQKQLTLGQEFNRESNPHERRIRRRWLGRKQYRAEFELIRQKQQPHQQLDDTAWKQIEHKIFFQRPLKSQKHLRGRCELEKDRRGRGLARCLLAMPIAQEFRILQKVNDLRVTTVGRRDDPLNEEERQLLVTALRETAELTWSRVKTLLQLGRTASFSHQEGDEKLIGNRTNAKMTGIFGNRWHSLTEVEQEAVILDVVHYRKPEALEKRAINAWNLTEEKAKELAFKTHLEDDYASHSKVALRKFVVGQGDVPGLRNGASYSTIRRAIYPESFESTDPIAKLPPVNNWKSDIRNPAVIRALTELRKVVNAIVAKYGKPTEIHLELARELRNSREKRKAMHKSNEENRKRRERVIQEVIQEAGIGKPSRRDIDKWILADECNWCCPYCGDQINRRKLLGAEAGYNVEHIYPRRYLDDSYMNKTIACRTCNDAKGDRSPAQAFHGTQYVEILQRVERFQGGVAEIKLDRFKRERPEEDPVERQLNDTRYNSRLAAKYVGLLFGGRNDISGKQRVFTPTGQITAKVRANWQLNELLGEPDNEKDRTDHRHHAIDAVVIALQTQRNMQFFAEAASQSERQHSRHFFDRIPFPWESFKRDVATAINAIRVSHRPTRTIAGPLHAETIYSKEHRDKKGKPEYRIRKHLSKLTVKEIEGEQIVDPYVRKAVQESYHKHVSNGVKLPSKMWSDDPGANADNFPRLVSSKKDGPGSIIRRVRLSTDAKPRKVGAAERARNYASGKDSNYASLVYSVLDKQGRETKWVHEILDRLTAHQILSANHCRDGEKVLLPKEAETFCFKFALRKNDMLLLKGENGQDMLYRVQKFSDKEIQLCEHNRQTVNSDERNPWNRITSIDNLRKRNARLVKMSPTGEMS